MILRAVMVNLGKEIEKEKRNERKLAPCMNVFINFLPYTTLDLFHPKQWLQKKIKHERNRNLKKWPTGQDAAK